MALATGVSWGRSSKTNILDPVCPWVHELSQYPSQYMPEMVPGELASEATAAFDKVKFDTITIDIFQYNPITQYFS